MKRLVYSYLANVNIENTNWKDLIIELVSVFDLPKSHVKYLVRIYLNYLYDKKIVTEFICSKPKADNTDVHYANHLLPILTRVRARTIAMDLVSVQALSTPRISLHYFDYMSKPEPKLNLFQKLIGRLKKLIIFVKIWGYDKKI